jgi:hypothetical protein
VHFHLPKPLHGWREFAGEVGIIVLGVLLALSAEQLVEAGQWRDKVSRAEGAMRLELGADNGPQAYGRVIIGRCLDMQITHIHDGPGHVPVDELRQWVQAYTPPFSSWDSEAWKTVLGSDVGSHMGPERLVQWSSPYRVLTDLTQENHRERDLTIQLHEVLPPTGDPSSADLQELRREAAQLRTLNAGFYRASQLVLARSQALGAPVAEPIKRELLREAKMIYGDCARAPDPNAKPLAQKLETNLHWLPPSFGN